jgi:hypothetical protein
MDYAKAYNRLMERAKDRRLEGYSESHHILPKCMGGGNEPENLARLTAEEHFVAHQLLVKMHPEVRGLIFALVALCMDRDGVRLNNKLYGWARRRAGDESRRRKTGVPRPAYVREKIRIGNTGRVIPSGHRTKTSAALKGRPHSAEHNAKVSAALMGRPGTRRGAKLSEETKAKQRAAALGRRHLPEAMRKMRDSYMKMTPEQRSARAIKAWETKRQKLQQGERNG